MIGLSTPCWHPIRIWKKSSFPFIRTDALTPRKLEVTSGWKIFPLKCYFPNLPNHPFFLRGWFLTACQTTLFSLRRKERCLAVNGRQRTSYL